jgi:hypothetical protein
MMRVARSVGVLGPLALVGVLAGCGEMGRFDIVVTLEKEGFRKTVGTIPSVEVNIVGINDVEYQEWVRKPMTQYWEPDDSLRTTTVRKGYTGVMTFGEEKPGRLVLFRRDPIWNDWEAKGARNLFILTNFPRVTQDQLGDADARRRILPLQKDRWAGYYWGKRVIWLEVTPSGLICHTTPRPPQPVQP